MFGHNDDLPQPQNDNQAADSVAESTETSPASPAPSTAPPAPATDWQHPGTPLTTPSVEPVSATTTPLTQTENVVKPTNDSAHTTGDLADLRQKALGQLSPLVNHLDQSPEDKFRVLMMMIQASDDQSQLQEAYETAQKITDEKTKAQALLDVINEINYFTQHKD
jgi:hypothetical protein